MKALRALGHARHRTRKARRQVGYEASEAREHAGHETRGPQGTSSTGAHWVRDMSSMRASRARDR